MVWNKLERHGGNGFEVVRYRFGLSEVRESLSGPHSGMLADVLLE